MTKILISNDDGINALGLQTLANSFAEKGYDVFVVAPDQERSATGHALTMFHPIRAQVVESVFHPDVKAWSCSGTPSDCVKLALGALLDSPPDFVLSGINQGSNIGTDVLYSGTVSAAMEGMIEGIPSIAFSLTNFKLKIFEPAAKFATILVERLIKNPLPELMLLNVNVPPVKWEEIAGVKITRQGVRRYFDVFEQRIDPRGKTYYWLAGEAIADLEQPADPLLPEHIETDVQAIRKNYITITPLHYNLTYPTGVNNLQNFDLSL
jgi:5'-nucleotidase